MKQNHVHFSYGAFSHSSLINVYCVRLLEQYIAVIDTYLKYISLFSGTILFTILQDRHTSEGPFITDIESCATLIFLLPDTSQIYILQIHDSENI